MHLVKEVKKKDGKDSDMVSCEGKKKLGQGRWYDRKSYESTDVSG